MRTPALLCFTAVLLLLVVSQWGCAHARVRIAEADREILQRYAKSCGPSYEELGPPSGMLFARGDNRTVGTLEGRKVTTAVYIPPECANIDYPEDVDEAKCSEELDPFWVPPATFTVRDCLDRIMRWMPRYRWVIEEGVINILPKPGEEYTENGKNPLDWVIKKLEIKHLNSSAARHPIMKAAGLENYYLRHGYDYAGGLHTCRYVDLSLRNVTVREALNRVAKADGKALWVADYWPGKDGETGSWMLTMHTERTAVHKQDDTRLVIEVGDAVECYPGP